jgi:hypothetical protein
MVGMPFFGRGTLKDNSFSERHPSLSITHVILESYRLFYNILESYRLFYNAERMNQSSVCGDKPPYVAFPNLPVLPSIADEIDPDVWLEAHHGLVFKRRLDNKGCTTVDCHSYYVGSAYAGELARFHLDARQRCFHVVVKGNTVRQLEVKGLIGEKLSFSAYLKRMLEEARSIDRHRQAAQRNTAATG